MEMMDTYQTKRRGGQTCWCCSGSREQEVGGFMKGPCRVCNAVGFIYPEEKKIVDRRSKSYRTAIKELEALGLSKEEAEAKLEEAA